MDEVTHIDSPELARIAGAVLEVAAALEKTADSLQGLDGATLGAVEGSAMCRVSLPAAAQGWDGSLTTLAERVQEFGAGLGQAAADYREADTAAAARVRASGHPGGRG